MSSTNAPNASGMSPHDSKALKERDADDSEEKILAAMKELYSCKPQESSYDVYATDAVFQDPIGIAEGVHSIKAQFNGLAKLFPRADIAKFRVLETPGGAPLGTIFIDQDVAYYRDPKTTSPTKTLNSLLTLHTNAQNQVTRHVEEWDHKRDASKEDGFFGMLNDQRKKVTASLVDKLVSSDPPTKD